MSDMRYDPSLEIRSAVWLMLNVISLGVIQLRARLEQAEEWLAGAGHVLRGFLRACRA